MIHTLIKNWWLLALRGLLALVFSVMTFLMQSSVESLTLQPFALKGMVVFLGMLALAAGACTIAAGIWSSGKGKSWLLFVDGLAVGIAGFVLIFSNSITFSLVTRFLVALAGTIGFIELATARSLRRHVPDEWFLGLAGAGSIGFALAFLWANPEGAGHVFIWLGLYSAFSAICMLGLAVRLRILRRAIHRLAAQASSQ